MKINRPPAGFGASGMLLSVGSSIPGSELARLPVLIWAAVTNPAAGPVEGAAVIVCPAGADRLPDSCVYAPAYPLCMQSMKGIMQDFRILVVAQQRAPPCTSRQGSCSPICLRLYCCTIAALPTNTYWKVSNVPQIDATLTRKPTL